MCNYCYKSCESIKLKYDSFGHCYIEKANDELSLTSNRMNQAHTLYSP